MKHLRKSRRKVQNNRSALIQNGEIIGSEATFVYEMMKYTKHIPSAGGRLK